MAQECAADYVGTGAFEFAVAMAKAFGRELLARTADHVCSRGALCDAAAALVSRMVPVLVASWIPFQPAHWPLRIGFVFYFYNHTSRICNATDWQRYIAVKLSA